MLLSARVPVTRHKGTRFASPPAFATWLARRHSSCEPAPGPGAEGALLFLPYPSSFTCFLPLLLGAACPIPAPSRDTLTFSSDPSLHPSPAFSPYPRGSGSLPLPQQTSKGTGAPICSQHNSSCNSSLLPISQGCKASIPRGEGARCPLPSYPNA